MAISSITHSGCGGTYIKAKDVWSCSDCDVKWKKTWIEIDDNGRAKK